MTKKTISLPTDLAEHQALVKEYFQKTSKLFPDIDSFLKEQAEMAFSYTYNPTQEGVRESLLAMATIEALHDFLYKQITKKSIEKYKSWQKNKAITFNK